MVILLLALISFHQWGWTLLLFISARIHWLGWFTGSGIPLDCDLDQAVEGLAGILDWAPPMQVGWHWGPLLGGSHGDFKGKGVQGLGASSYCLAAPPNRKMVRPGGIIGSSPNSSSTLNLTCFFTQSLGGCYLYRSLWRMSSVGVVASSHHALLWDSCDLDVGEDPGRSGWATHQQDMIIGG